MLREGELLAGRYRILSVHPGGMGVVCIVEDLESGERHAAKTVREEFRDEPRVRRRFEQEVRTWVSLGRHPNVVNAEFVRDLDGVPFLFLEYIDGPTLARVLREDGPLLPGEAMEIGIMCGRGLLFAHESVLGGGLRGLVHRDVKPENIFVTRERVAKVSDFGLAKVLSGGLSATAEGIGMGTPFYVSPEQLKGSPDVDGRADIYSFGAVLYQAVAGRLPLMAESLESQIYQILRMKPEPPSRWNPCTPKVLDDITLKCLEKDPARRYAGFRPLLADLAAALATVELTGCPRSTCPSCGYSSAREPRLCPVCGAPMGPPAPAVILHAPVADEGEELPAKLRIRSVEVSPRTVRVGEEMTVTVAVVNEGNRPARRCVMALVVPDRDTFRRVGPDEAWRGEIPPSGVGRSFDISYRLVPLREGSFALPVVEVRDESGTDHCVFVRSGEVVPFSVTFNYHLPMEGRERERKAVFDFAARRRAGFILVEGEAGGGKSRFLEEVSADLGTAGFRVFRGKALEIGREPLKVLHDVARGIFGIGSESLAGPSLMARVIDRLAPVLGEDPATAAFFAAFLREVDPSEAQAEMRGYLWYRLLSALAREGPVVLSVDDLQWADDGSVDLLENVVRRAAEEGVPLMVAGAVLTADPDERTRRRISRVRDRFAALATNLGLTQRITLRPLRDEDVKRLFDDTFPGHTLAEDHPWLIPTLTAITGGNAFHLTHVLRLLREHRDEAGEPLVSAEEGSWRLRPGFDESALRNLVPQAVYDMVQAVILPLPEETRHVLELAAIVGEEFDARLLDELTGGRGGLDRALEVMEQADLIRAQDDAGENFRFTSSVMPLIVERRVRERSRRAYARLHREVAEAMEKTLGPAGLRRSAERYARHLLLAGEREKAFRWLVLAAETSVRQQQYLRSEALLRQADRLLEEGVETGEEALGSYYFLCGEVGRVTGRFSEAILAYEQAAGHLSGPDARADLARTLWRMGEAHRVLGETDRAIYCIDLGVQIQEDIGDAAGMARSLGSLGQIQVFLGDEARALEALTRARELARKAGDDRALADVLDHLAGLRARQDRPEEARELYEESRDIAERTGDRLGVARSLNGLGNLALDGDRLEEAEGLYQRAIEIRREVGDREGTANLLCNLGVVHDRRGDSDAALRYYRRSVELNRSIGSRRGLATVLNNIGVVNLARGDVSMAVQRFEESLHIRREIGDRDRLGLSLANLAEARALAGDPEADPLYEEAIGVHREAGDSSGLAGVLASRAACRRRRGDLDGAAEDLRVATTCDSRSTRVRAQVHLEMAELLAARGDVEGARRAAESGNGLAVEAGDRLARGQGLRLLGRMRRLTGDRAGALSALAEAEVLLASTSGPELVRVLLEEAECLGTEDPARSRAVWMRARGLLDALEARGARLPAMAKDMEETGRD
jgi:tetratricopeptide (TPR) repeat protein/tRNA A-37 threonylcarbamoyl transferase component Bud32